MQMMASGLKTADVHMQKMNSTVRMNEQSATHTWKFSL